MVGKRVLEFNSSGILSSFLDCIALSFEISCTEASFFITENAEALRTLIVLGGVESGKVRALFQILELRCDALLHAAIEDISDRTTLGKMANYLSFCFVSKIEEIFNEGCLFFESFFKRCEYSMDGIFAADFLDSLFIDNGVFLDNSIEGIEVGSERAKPIVEILSLKTVVCALGRKIAKVMGESNTEIDGKLVRFYLIFIRKIDIKYIHDLFDSIMKDLRSVIAEDGKDNWLKMNMRVACFLTDCEIGFCQRRLWNPLGYSDHEAMSISNRLLGIIVNKNTASHTICNIMIGVFEMVFFHENETSNQAPITRGANQMRSLPKAVFENLEKFFECFMTEKSLIVRSVFVDNISSQRTPPSVLDCYFEILKKIYLKSKQKLKQDLDFCMLGTLKHGITRLEDLSMGSRNSIFEILVEYLDHPFYFREIHTLLVVFVLSLQSTEFNQDILIKSAKLMTKNLLQIKFTNLGNPSSDSAQVTQMNKHFRISMQLNILLHIITLVKLNWEDGRYLNISFKKIQESCMNLSFSKDIQSIMQLLDGFDELNKGIFSQDLVPNGGFKANGAFFQKNSKHSKTPLARLQLPGIPNDALQRPKRGEINKAIEETSSHLIVDDSSPYRGLKPLSPISKIRTIYSNLIDISNHMKKDQKSLLSKNPLKMDSHFTTMKNTSKSRRLSEEISRVQSAKKRVNYSLLNNSLNMSQFEAQSPTFNVNNSLVRQVKDWQDLPLVDKTKLITIKREAKQLEKQVNPGFNFFPETNPHKNEQFLFEFDSRLDPSSNAVYTPFTLEHEEEKDVKAIKILLYKNRHLIKQIFDYLVTLKTLKVIEKRMISISSLAHLLKISDLGSEITPEECKTLIHRLKQNQKDISDASCIDFDEFRIVLVHIADLFVRKHTSYCMNTIDGLEYILKCARKRLSSKMPSSHPGDPEVIEYLKRTNPDVLPLVRYLSLEL